MTTSTPFGDESTRDGESAVPLNAYASSPERTVFTESGNPDGWISTNLTVSNDP
jgi:hypothetical protein